MARSSYVHVSECEHQGALCDAAEPAYNVAKPWLTVLDNSFTPQGRRKRGSRGGLGRPTLRGNNFFHKAFELRTRVFLSSQRDGFSRSI